MTEITVLQGEENETFKFLSSFTGISPCPTTTPGMTNILVIYAFIHLFIAGIKFDQLCSNKTYER